MSKEIRIDTTLSHKHTAGYQLTGRPNQKGVFMYLVMLTNKQKIWVDYPLARQLQSKNRILYIVTEKNNDQRGSQQIFEEGEGDHENISSGE